ncbi:MAG: phosphatidate cytidylyltransferase [Thermoguttaceae bacterium]|nr:phosphatidate cytidylyltransferase [Thermoguttaceae bacterium]MDW8077541.1 phosphatidate cytidylyltransferase [Thermoguttaceae bacterium]
MFPAIETQAKADEPSAPPTRDDLSRRVVVGTSLAGFLLAVCYGDYWLEILLDIPGVALFPVLMVFAMAATREILELTVAGGVRPIPWVVYSSCALVICSSWFTPLWYRFARTLYERWHTSPSDWTLFALASGMMLVFIAEMRRYTRPGGITVNVASSVLAMLYIGLLFSFLVQIRIVWGLRALLATLIAVKFGDTAAYIVGKAIGRSKLAPGLSPKKTVEGALGAVAASCFGSWLALSVLMPAPTGSSTLAPSWGWLPFGILVGIFGILGDLAESLIKRDVARKDSGTLIPGFGGVLDLVDSVLISSPVAYACWAFGLVG